MQSDQQHEAFSIMPWQSSSSLLLEL